MKSLLACDHSNESHWAVFLCDTVNCDSADETSVRDDFNESYWALLPCAYCVIQGGLPTYFNAPVVAERGCRSERLVLSRLNSSPWVVSTLSLESLIVTSLGERILLRSLINVAAEVGVARRMGVKSLKQKKKIRKVLVKLRDCQLVFSLRPHGHTFCFFKCLRLPL